MGDKRRNDRFTVEGIHCSIMSATEVEIVNISIGGAALIANGRLNIGRDYTLKLEEEGRTCSVNGTIIWSVLSGNRKNANGESVPLYKAGMKFKDVQSSKMTEVLDFIKSYQKSPEQRVIVRFDIVSPEKATLNYPFNYRVKKVSLGGLLIETSEPFGVGDILSMELSFGSNNIIGFLGRVASCLSTSESDSDQYDVGVEFVEISDPSLAILKEFIKSL
ncbi:MAG: PilZ domain-containing protein [Thermodesulfovibrionales bacterium]|jgi:Tfp pilus assembly protein PilZ